MRATSLARAAAAVWLLVAILCALFGRELAWSARALWLYATHRFPPLRERELAAEAMQLAASGSDMARALARIEASAAIDPNAFPFLHGEIERRADHAKAAIDRFAEATRVDPSDAAAWLRRADLLRAAGRGDEARRVLAEAVAWFSAELEGMRPRPDPEVEEPFNARATEAWDRHVRGLAALRAALARASREAG